MKLSITIPTKLSEIKLETYQKFLNVIEGNDESNFLYQKMVQIFCDVDLKTVTSMKQSDFQDAVTIISKLLNQTGALKNRIVFNGVEFGFIPNLEDMTSGEYMDLDNYITDWQDMHKAMAALYRPITSKIGDKYLIEPYRGSAEYAEQMKALPLDVALPASVFFWDLGDALLSSTATYLQKNKQVQNTLDKLNSENAGDGIAQFTDLLREILDDSARLQSFPSINALPS